MKKYLWFAPVAMLSLLTAFGFTAIENHNTAQVQAQSQSSGPLHVFFHSDNVKLINVGTRSDYRGDYVTFDSPMFASNNTTHIGSNSGFCIDTSNTLSECTWTAFLPHGSLAVQGPEAPDGSLSTLAIVGGTGIYEHAQGHVTFAHKQGNQYEAFFYIN